jgi:predicted metal-dependent hydrolase
MTSEEIREASEVLERAAADVDDENLRERLSEQADQLAALAERDRGPDHGRVARHQGSLRDIRADAGGALDEEIDAANDLLNAYRETVEGV